jgi:hypothetical protein
MRLFTKVKDGGPESPVDAFVLIEIKALFSIVLLRFNPGGRPGYHSHAFNAWTWFLWGDMVEMFPGRPFSPSTLYRRSWRPKVTPRLLMHRVWAYRTSWAFTLRGPWAGTWQEQHYGGPSGVRTITLTHGRKVVGS